MKHTTIAVDLAKNVFEIGVSEQAGKVSEQLRVSRPKLVSFLAKRPGVCQVFCVNDHRFNSGPVPRTRWLSD
jgi:hypothetical protein